MKKTVLYIVLVCIIAGGIIGVAIGESTTPPKQYKELEEYIGMVKKLQAGDDKSKREVLKQLNSNDNWTLLDEIGNPDIDEDDKYMTLGLNAMAYEAAMSKIEDYGNPQGVFVDGRDPEYSIRFIEKSLSAGSEVTYTIKKKKGPEIIAVVEMADGDLDVWMNGKKVEPSELVFRSELQSKKISVRLRNRRGYAVNFVVLNQH